jgi:uncharacterized membrane protein
LRVFLGVSSALFPLRVYILAGRVPPTLIVVILATLLAVRISLLGRLSRTQLLLVIAGLSVFTVLAYFDDQLRILKLYPVVINSAAACIGIYTLLYPPSAIKRLMVHLGTVVDEPATLYTRRLTAVWVVFFIFNGGVALYLAVAASTAAWAVYNGALSYLLIALLLGVEYPIRRAYQRRHRLPATHSRP